MAVVPRHHCILLFRFVYIIVDIVVFGSIPTSAQRHDQRDDLPSAKNSSFHSQCSKDHDQRDTITPDCYVCEIGSFDASGVMVHLHGHGRRYAPASNCQHASRCAAFRLIGELSICRLRVPPGQIEIPHYRLDPITALVGFRYADNMMITVVG